ncbi:adenylyl-sulfate kinase [Propionivibrio sp.]|uniref:adenylyl-sulfate kinase n=1 Tax=Propionivibrio sp. TaxID=2212460 RepID=UPI003BF3E16E
MNKSSDLVRQHATVTRERRERQNGHKSFVLCFTGLSGAGKSTLANAVEEQLHQAGRRTFVLDGDNIRHGLNRDLGFSQEDRGENLRRVGELSSLFVEAGVITLVALISPYKQDRELVRTMFKPGEFFEISDDLISRI